ncbi:MAG: deoxyribonuclease IV [Planctomycetota bacterium]|nr:MAG: deoxyribonuclease IV [Planctomycetota bacterium]
MTSPKPSKPSKSTASKPPQQVTSAREPLRTTPTHPLLGAHQSVAGGLSRAVERAVETGCRCLQIFTRNVNRWDAAPITAADAAAFRAAVSAAGLACVVVHDSYLINPGSADETLREKSIAGLVLELERAEQLAIPWVVAHPGAAGIQPRDTAVERAADGIATALSRSSALAAGILVETTAGQGSCLGHSFEEIAAILARIDAAGHGSRVGVCLDTCHVFAAGYPLFPAADLDATIASFDRLIGLDRLKVIHANDSKKPRGSRVDRHAAIGEGEIGSAAFALFINHPRLAGIPLILETPKEGADGKVDPAEDRRNLATLHGMVTANAARA